MNISIQPQSNLAIYEQLVEQFKDEIIKGNLKEGDIMPSIRALAKELRISVITTKRAYEELEKDGLIYSVAGKGFYVNQQDTNILREKKVQQIEGQMSEVIRSLKKAELSLEDAKDMLELLWEDAE
ncbi:MAG: GntR family transcriptional regulator [Lachnospiraceae bacterium]|nr:GntR family transcriptional regulator [Lachnospiraceae bacterium]